MKKCLIIAVLAMSIILIGCASKEKAPIVDGTKLKYNLGMYGPISGVDVRFVYKFKNVDSETLKVKIIPELPEKIDGKTINKADMEKLTKRIPEVEVTRQLKLKKKKSEDLKVGYVGPMWIPSDKRKKGATVNDLTCREIKKWKKWQVCLFKGSIDGIPGRVYYHKGTGVLVGADFSPPGAMIKLELLENNIPQLK